MPRSEWDELLGHSGIGGASQSDVQHELETAASLGVASSGSASGPGGASGTASALTQSSTNQVTQQMSSLVEQITGLNSTEQSAINAIQGNTQAVTQNTSTKGTGSSAASQVGSAAESLFGGALSLSPILSGILSLFGGGSSTQATQTPFMLPAPVNYQAGVTGTSGASPVSYGAGGQPRAESSSAPTQVTVQVNAMDSQSFLDHSDDIANAVRTALLNSNSLGDVISDL